MATIKSHTDLEQSRKLAEILPLKNADMYYWCGEDLRIGGHKAMDKDYDIPCWSLAALLNIINKNFYPNIFHDGESWNLEVTHHDNNAIKYDIHSDDIIDAVFEMILKLHEKNLL